MRILYFDGVSGASGDMILGALLDLGLSIDDLHAELAALRLDGYTLGAERVQRAGIAATRAIVDTQATPHQRTLSDIGAIIAASALPEPDRARVMTVFQRLAEAEADAHGVTPQEVHFHEVGAIDAIVDIAAVITGLRLLAIEKVYSAPLVLGRGVARGEHGELPAPAPATLQLIERAGAPIAAGLGEPEFEALTPTGAALLTTLATFGRPAMRLLRTGYGAGGRDIAGRPNVLRAWLGETQTEPASTSPARLLLIECNIDDMNPEIYEWARERIIAAGAIDVWYAPVQMKKNRPGATLSALAPPEAETAVTNAFLRETSTLGVRVRDVWRHEAERKTFQFSSTLGEAQAKARVLPDGAVLATPEYDSCRALAEASGLPLIEVYRRLEPEAQAEAIRQFGAPVQG